MLMFITMFSFSWLTVADLADWFNQTIQNNRFKRLFCLRIRHHYVCLFIWIAPKRNWWWVKHSPSRSSSKSSTKNSRSGGRLGCFSVFTSCWILAETRLLTGTPMKHKCMLMHKNTQTLTKNKQKQKEYYHSYNKSNFPEWANKHTQGCLGLND